MQKHIKHIALLLACQFGFMLMAWAQKPQITNIRVSLDAGEKAIKIQYDASGLSYTNLIEVIIHQANGGDVRNPKLRGDFGGNQVSGSDKTIWWDVPKDQYIDPLKIVIEIIAYDTSPRRSWVPPIICGAVLIGASWQAVVLRTAFTKQRADLATLAQAIDPNDDGIINTPSQYTQWQNTYAKTESVASKKGLFFACAGLAAVAATFEVILLTRKPKTYYSNLKVAPASESLGISLVYQFKH